MLPTFKFVFSNRFFYQFLYFSHIMFGFCSFIHFHILSFLSIYHSLNSSFKSFKFFCVVSFQHQSFISTDSRKSYNRCIHIIIFSFWKHICTSQCLEASIFPDTFSYSGIYFLPVLFLNLSVSFHYVNYFR